MFRTLENVKVVNTVPPGAIVDNASWTSTAIDTLGFSQALLLWILGALDIAMVALKVQECETSGGSYTDVPGCVFGTSTNVAGSTSALPSATADNNVYGFNLDLRGRKRYLKIVATGGDGAAGSYGCGLAILSHPETSLDTAALRGLGDALRG